MKLRDYLSVVFAISAMLAVSCSLEEKEKCFPGDLDCLGCKSSEHMNEAGTACEANTDTDCGSEHTDCSSIENAKSSRCDPLTATCKISCKSGYRLHDGACIGNDEEPCGSADDCTEPENARKVSCTGGVCKIECDSGYYLAKSKCIENIYTSCDSDKTCTSLPGVSKAKCDEGVCEISSCKSDYHLTDKNASCIADTEKLCGTSEKDCTEIPNISLVSCNDGRCVVESCASGYHPSVDASACEENNDTEVSCGPSKKNCTDIDNVSLVSCKENRCVIETCRTGFHPSEDYNYCDADSTSVCGNKRQKCTAIPHSKNQECVQGICEYECTDGAVRDGDTCSTTNCMADYHPNSDATDCLPDTNEECGISMADCTALHNADDAACNKGTCKYTCNQGTEKIAAFDNGCLSCVTQNVTVKVSSNDNNGNTIIDNECIKGSFTGTMEYNAKSLSSTSLVYVESEFKITDNSYNGGNRFEFNALETLGKFTYTRNSSSSSSILAAFDFPKLKKIITRLNLKYLNVNQLEFPELEIISSGISLEQTQTVSMSFPKLKTVGSLPGDSFTMYYNGYYNYVSGSSIEFGALKTITGSLSLNYNRINYIKFPKLTDIKGGLTFYPNSGYKTVYSFDSLENIDSDFTISSSSNGTSELLMPKLVKIGGYFSWNGQDALDFSLLEIIGGDFTYSSRSDLSLPSLKTIGGKMTLHRLTDYERSCTRKDNRDECGCVYENENDEEPLYCGCAKSASIKNDNSLHKIELPKLETAGDIKITENAALDTLDLSSLKTVKSLVLSGIYSSYTSYGGGTGNCLAKYNFALYNKTLTTISLPELTDAESIQISDFVGLTKIDMPKLKKIADGKITITGCPKLTDCNLGENQCIIE